MLHTCQLYRWYLELCPTQKRVIPEGAEFPKPTKITSLRRIAAKLLRLTWEGYPLYYDEKHGWGYLVPGREDGSDEGALDRELQRQEDEAEGKLVELDRDAEELAEVRSRFPIA